MPPFVEVEFSLWKAGLAQAGAHLAADPGGEARHLAAALEINPGNLAAHMNLGAILAQQGKAPEALVQFEKAVAFGCEVETALGTRRFVFYFRL